MADLSELLRIRAANDNDTNYMRKTWLKSIQTPWSPMQSALGPRDFWEGHHRIVSRLLSTCDVRVACSNDNESTIAGWACLEAGRRVVHFVHVREEMRRYGVARMLLEGVDDGERPVWYTHRTGMSDKLGLPDKWRFSFYRAVT